MEIEMETEKVFWVTTWEMPYNDGADKDTLGGFGTQEEAENAVREFLQQHPDTCFCCYSAEIREVEFCKGE